MAFPFSIPEPVSGETEVIHNEGVREPTERTPSAVEGILSEPSVPLRELPPIPSLGEVPLRIVYPPVTREEVAQLQVGDIIISKSGASRTVLAFVGDTVLFMVKKGFHGSDLDRAFMDNACVHLRQQDYDTLHKGDIVYSLDRNVPHAIVDVYRYNDPVGSEKPFVSGITTLSTEMASHFISDTKLRWMSHIEKAPIV